MNCVTSEKLHRSNYRQRNRGGFTLIHMMVVISMLSVMMTMSGVIIQFVMRSEHAVSRQAVLELTVFELSRQFRADVHAATKISPSGHDEQNTASMELQGPSDEAVRVQYRVDGETLIRESFTRGQPVAREVYRLPECRTRLQQESAAADQVAAVGQAQFVTVNIDRPGLSIQPQQQPVRSNRRLTIVAELGRDSRLIASLQKISAKPETTDRAKDATQADDRTGSEVSP